MIRRTARRALALAAAGTLLLSIFSLAHAQARTGSLSERGLGEQACNGLWLAPDASPADGPALDRLRAEALASPEVQLLRKFLRRHGYVARDARAGGTVSSRDSVVLLPLSKRGDRTRGAVVAYAVGADGTRTIEAATLLMRGRAVEAEREYTVNGARVVRTNSFVSCMVACLAVRCSAIYRCPTFFGPGVFLACASAVCGSRVPGCVRTCR